MKRKCIQFRSDAWWEIGPKLCRKMEKGSPPSQIFFTLGVTTTFHKVEAEHNLQLGQKGVMRDQFVEEWLSANALWQIQRALKRDPFWTGSQWKSQRCPETEWHRGITRISLPVLFCVSWSLSHSLVGRSRCNELQSSTCDSITACTTDSQCSIWSISRTLCNNCK